MNKTAIKNFATWARNKLIADITYKAGLMGLTATGIADPLPQSTGEMQFFDIGTTTPFPISGVELAQRRKLVEIINGKAQQSDYITAFKNVVEEVAYTWFNRLIAVRFMELGDYLPSRIRVLSSESPNKSEPDLVTTPFDAGLNFNDKEKTQIAQLKLDNKLDELFRLLFIKQCNALNTILPELFESTSDYSELLLNISYTDKDGVVSHLVSDITEDDFKDQVQIIGWLYQYYNTEPKDETFALLKKNVKITKERIPSATQLFTPDWIVRYMVENSLGRLWLEGHSDSEIKENWKYYLEEAEQEESVKTQLQAIHEERKTIKPEDIKVIDPCMGSGHILVYAFDVLMQIYESQGYSKRDAARSILQNNLFGLDIDKRAYQLTYFSLMMKGRQNNRRIFSEDVTPQVYCPDGYADGEEYGSLLRVEELEPMPIEPVGQLTLGEMDYATKLSRWNFRRLLAQKYDVVITNPPYMGSSGMNGKLAEFVKAEYPDSKSDLFAAFIEKCGEMAKSNGYTAMITQHAWMFLSSFEKLRTKMLLNDIVNMTHLGPRAFAEIGGEVVQSTMFVMRKAHLNAYKGAYVRLVDYPDAELKETKYLEAIADSDCKYLYSTNADNFAKIPGMPVAYWVSEKIVKAYDSGDLMEGIAAPKVGMQTSNNDAYLRLWYEINFSEFNGSSLGLKWIKYLKGGAFRKWYGNLEHLLFYNYSPAYILKQPNARVLDMEFLEKTKCTWTDLTSGIISFRLAPEDSFYDISGHCYFPSEVNKYWLLGYSNCLIFYMLKKVFNSTFHCQVGDVAKIIVPPIETDNKNLVSELAEKSVALSKYDWDSFETSWDFTRHPLMLFGYQNDYGLVDYKTQGYGIAMKYDPFLRIFEREKGEVKHPKRCLIRNCFRSWGEHCEDQFAALKANEEELNRIFIDIYGLQDELTPDVSDKDVTVARIYDSKEDIPLSMKGNGYVLTKADVVKSLISYAVGCMFGRYSLDVEGLAYAGGDWDNGKYTSFIPDKDNILPITDEEYYDDDIVGRFVEFVKTVYGAETLEENLEFIANALAGKGNSSREIIRGYFLKDFFKDHVKTYKKRPIYWLFDSGKQDGFKALVYMHRYDENTIGNLRIDYLHRIQRVYDSEIARMQETIENSSNGREVAAAEKRKERLTKQLKETKDYDAKIAHLALARIAIDLDDGVKVNYDKVQTDADGKALDVLGKI